MNQKASVCLFSPPLSQSAIFPFDLLFIWLSLCITRLFILHFNIWWDHLWSWVCCSGVTLTNNSFFLSVVSSIIVGKETLSVLLIIPFKFFDLKCKHTNKFIYLFILSQMKKILNHFQAFHPVYCLWLVSPKICYLFILYPVRFTTYYIFLVVLASVLLKSIFRLLIIMLYPCSSPLSLFLFFSVQTTLIHPHSALLLPACPSLSFSHSLQLTSFYLSPLCLPPALNQYL